MSETVGQKTTQLHPLHRAIKECWTKLFINKDIKQSWVADRCGVDASRVSRWKSVEYEDFPPTEKYALFIEAMQKWPGVEKWEPLEGFNRYFECTAVGLHHNGAQPIQALAGLVASQCGKMTQQILDAMAPDSDGGVEISPRETLALSNTVSRMRRCCDDLDDAIQIANAGRKS